MDAGDVGEQILKLTSIEMIEIRLPLVHYFETSFGRTTERRIVLVRVADEDGVEGWGECTAGEGPFYSYEWTDTAWNTIRTFLAPMLIGRDIKYVEDTFGMMKAVRGHRMAKAAIETACWDLKAKLAGVPLWQYLGGTKSEIACGVSIGIQDNVASLLGEIAFNLKQGYQRIKIKIKRGWDVEIIGKVRARFPDIQLMADANSAYRLSDAAILKSLDTYNLMMIEQPLAHNDMFDHATLQRELKTPICLDESIHSAEDALHAIEIAACRVVNLKLGRVGGHGEAKRVERVCRDRGVPVWCGGMLESGIGRAHNIAMATLTGFTLPGDISASKRYWTEDVIAPEVEITANGTIVAPLQPGIGYRVNRERIDSLAVRSEIITSSSI